MGRITDNRADVYQDITDQMIAMIEAGMSTAEQKSAMRRRKTRPSCYTPGGVA